MSGPDDLLAAAHGVDPGAVHAALTVLLDRDRPGGVAAAFDILAGEPRIKPSTGLLIDPTDAVRARWSRRVAAARALLESPAAIAVFDELYDELSDDVDLAADVLAVAHPCVELDADHVRALDALER